MLDKKKHHYLQLVIVFTAVTIISLMSAWGHRSNTETSMDMMGQMMGQSMGKMMSSMHASNISLSSLFQQQEKMEMASGMESHHQAGNKIKTTHFITTAVIVILLPFVLAGAVFLTVMWIK